MASRLADHVKSLVIQQWLQGLQRDLIAANNGLSAGAVTNAVNEWRRGLGLAIVDDLRELGITFRKVGITPAQCALGFRVGMMMVKLGIKEDDLESFVLDIYSRCIDLGLSPEDVALHMKDLLEFSKMNIVPLSQISEFIHQKADEKKRLEEEIQTLKGQIKMLEEEKSGSEDRRSSALHEENITAAELKSYSDLKEELGRHGIPIDDVSKFAKVVHGISQKGYHVGRVIEEFSDLESARNDYWSYQVSMPGLKKKYDDLNQECSMLEQSVNFYKQRLSLYDELHTFGFGLKELKLLRNTINEIADANSIPQDQAHQKFYRDIEEEYDDKVGLELQLNKLRSEITTVNNNLNFSRVALLAQPLVGPSLQRLFSKGVVEQDIVEFANLFERFHSYSGDGGSGGSSSTNIDKQSLISALQKYGGIKSTIQELNQQVDELQRQKKDLYGQNQKMLSILANSKPVVEFLHGSADSLSNDGDNIKILAMIAFILYTLYIRYVGIEKFIDGGLEEFVPLSRAAAAGRSETISVPKLKLAVAKALTILITKLDTKSQTNEDTTIDQDTTSLINKQQKEQ